MSRAATAAPAPAEPILLRQDRESIAFVILNRPQARNALSVAMLSALTDMFASIRDDRAVRAVVIAANGPAFCSGHDLKELSAHRQDTDRGRGFFGKAFEFSANLMQAIVHLPQPVIAAVDGIASAAGIQLVASCDLVVATENADLERRRRPRSWWSRGTCSPARSRCSPRARRCSRG
jgi:enoyl-CoA hydratase/carnithine racemase